MSKHLDLGLTGAKRQSHAVDSPDAMLLQLLMMYPRENEEEIWRRWATKYLEDRVKFEKAVLRYWFANNYRRLLKQNSIGAKPRKRESVIKALSKKILETVGRKYVLDVVLGNKKLRDMTGAECATYGSIYKRLADRVKPNQTIGSVLTENEVRKILGIKPLAH